MFDFGADAWVHTVYYAAAENKDMMGVLYSEGGVLHLRYRFRYYNSPDPFDTTDKKNWYHVEDPTNNLEDARAAIASVLLACNIKWHPDVLDVFDVEGGAEKFQKMLAEKEWCHMKKLTPEEAKEMGLDHDAEA